MIESERKTLVNIFEILKMKKLRKRVKNNFNKIQYYLMNINKLIIYRFYLGKNYFS